MKNNIEYFTFDGEMMKSFKKFFILLCVLYAGAAHINTTATELLFDISVHSSHSDLTQNNLGSTDYYFTSNKQNTKSHGELSFEFLKEEENKSKSKFFENTEIEFESIMLSSVSYLFFYSSAKCLFRFNPHTSKCGLYILNCVYRI